MFRPRVLGVIWVSVRSVSRGGNGLAFLGLYHIQYEQTVQEHATYKLA